MNSINFLSGNKFPMYREALAKMQDMTSLVARLTGLGGQSYILSGCTPDGNGGIGDGFVVINGELLPFIGSAVSSSGKVTIQETRDSVNAFGVVYPEIYVTRVARFAVSGEYNWSDFEPIKTNRELYAQIQNIKGIVPGIVEMWSGRIDRIPDDYLLCDGSIKSTNQYPELAYALGKENESNFALPDLRHRFIAGYDSAENDYNQIGKVGGLENVTLTEQQIPEHDHTNDPYFNKLSAKAADVDVVATPGSLDAFTPDKEYNVGHMTPSLWNLATIKKVGGSKSHENRPPYFVLAYIIKVR